MPANTTPKPKLERTYTCSICTTIYTTPRHSTTHFCSPKCRSSSKRLKVAEKRILSLPQCDEWAWVAREAKRSGSVEILQDVNLVELFSLYRRRYKAYGWNPETKTSKFHLCHISPASGTSTIGLLNNLNLFIGNSLPNQVHGNRAVQGRGLSISRHLLKRKWLVSKEDSDRKVLDKIVSYLGPVLIDYAKTNPIRKSQRFSLARWVYQHDASNQLSLAKLERLGLAELRKLRAAVEEKELYEINLTAKRSIVVALEETQRLSEQLPDGQHKSDLLFMLPVLRTVGAWLSRQQGKGGDGLCSILAGSIGMVYAPLQVKEGRDSSHLRDFISFQAFNALQGALLDRSLIKNTLRSYLYAKRLTPSYMDYAERLTLQADQIEKRQVFMAQIVMIRSDILSLGLASNIVVSAYLEEVRLADEEERILSNLHPTPCADQWDYSGIHIQVEDNYTPNPNNPRIRQHIEPPFVDF